MNTRNIRYFTTALRVLALGIWLNSAPAFAQNTVPPNDGQCERLFGLKPYVQTATELHNGWWFVPANASETLQQASLSYVSPHQRMLLNERDVVFVAVPKDAQVDAHDYLIVRKNRIKQGDYQLPFGDLVQIVGRAKYNPSNLIVALDEREGQPNKMQALEITKAFMEIQPTDRILPKACLVKAESVTVNQVTPSIAPHQTARVSALLNHAFFGAETSIVLIDKGENDGVKAGQNWQLLEKLAQDSNSAKIFGTAQVQQVFETQSILTVQRAVHEVQVGDLLRIVPSKP